MSVIVPVRNGRSDLLTLLGDLERQTLARSSFEIVIGDDGSTDGTTDGLASADGHVRVEVGPPANSYAARNRAVAAARGKILAFCDADCRPESNWLAQGLAELESTDMAAGRIRFDVPARRTVWTLIDMDGSKDHEQQVEAGVAETANLFLRRELYDAVEGFEEEVPEYGDFDFVERCVAAGARLRYAPTVVVWHPARTSGRALLRALWRYNYGYGMREGREGRVPEGVWARSWVPILETLRSRRRWKRSIGPDRRWLAANGVEASRRERIAATFLMYVVIPYLRSVAQARGWRDGVRLRKRAAAPETVRAY